MSPILHLVKLLLLPLKTASVVIESTKQQTFKLEFLHLTSLMLNERFQNNKEIL